jgi:tyrosinase
MANFTRRNAWNNGGTFANPNLLWYAKGVGVMQSHPLDDRNSWWFFAAIHGQFITYEIGFPGWGFIPGPPQVPTTPLPSQDLQNLYWDQCQHQSWYFAPWHRGYLMALEAQIRAAVVGLGGPSDWALPYWNYFGPNYEYEIPPAFTQQTLPDGTPNPLFVKARHGPQEDDVIYVSTGANANCQNETNYNRYGGPRTPFSHSGETSGVLENNPHNVVHTDVAGLRRLRLFSVRSEFVDALNAEQLPVGLRDSFQERGYSLSSQARVFIEEAPRRSWWIFDGTQAYNISNSGDQRRLDVSGLKMGLMSDPDIAALDPIFYLHHCNIDRMWAAWNAKGNSNPTDINWLSGPPAGGGRKFAMPMPDGSDWVYTPADVNSLSQLDYAYDDLTTGLPFLPATRLSQRLMRLGAAPAVASTAQGENMDGGDNAELLGAHDGALQIKGSGARATVRLDPDVRGRVSASLADASETNLPDRVYLRLENVRGTIDAFKLNVSVNQQNVGTAALFGLRRASLKDGQHGGTGLTFVFDITDIIDNLFLANALDEDSLDVRIEPNHAFADIAQLTIGRVSVYRQGQQ